MAIVTGDRYLDFLVKFVEKQAGPLLEGTLVLKLNPVGLHYVHSRLEALQELEGLIAGAPIDYLRAYVSDLGDHRALEQLRRILRLLTSLKVVSVLPSPARDPTPVSLSPFGRLRVLELRGCDLSTSAARGLLELRHTLEKIICLNSTGALRHVFASRIADIRESPLWNRLAFVSCACNGLVLMDESLQLLPAVETLDLSRNRFAKVDNLRKCTKLKHIDLGFNHLRTIVSFNEVTCRIVKLVLRNNALTTLHGIENLKSVEALDLSYNIISNFSEIEPLASLSSLQNLWLEGNPICYVRWYRAQVFSYFTNPEKLKLDERVISAREAWKMQIILTSRQKRPAGYGFYSPAKYGAEQEGSSNSKRKKLSRLACIEDAEQRRYLGSEAFDQESTSCNSENQRRDENAISDTDAEILDLMNRVEFMKKERSVLWLREFRDWLDQTPEEMLESSKFTDTVYRKEKDRAVRSRKQLGGSSRYVSDSVQDSGDENSTNILESDMSFTDTITGSHGHAYYDSSDKVSSNLPIIDGNREAQPILPASSGKGQFEASSLEEQKLPPLLPSRDSSVLDTLTAIDEILESRSSSAYPGSPPHYQEDILHRRQNLEEEFLQLSAGSYSAVSSDSDTSCDSSSCKYGISLPGADRILNEDPKRDIGGDHDTNFFDKDYYHKRNEEPCIDSYAKPISNIFEVPKPDDAKPSCTDDILADAGGGNTGNSDQLIDKSEYLEKRKCKQVPKRRIVSLYEKNFPADKVRIVSQKLNGILEMRNTDMEGGNILDIFSENGLCMSEGNIDKKLELINEGNSPAYDAENIKFDCCLGPDAGDSVKSYFHANVADPIVSETCLRYVQCNCLHQQGGFGQSEVAVLLSSENKLYLLLISASHDSSGACLKVLGSHRLGDITEVVVGIGLQVLRVCFENDTSYLFITKTIEKSRSLLGLLRICDSNEEEANRCSLRSWEQVQVKLFQKQIHGGLKMSIFLYSMLLFWHKNSKDDVGISNPYFSLDACCSLSNISEMVIEQRGSRCVTLTLDHVESTKLPFPARKPEEQKNKAKNIDPLLTWRLKWFSEETLLRFVALLKAMYAGMTMSPLPVKCIS